MYYKVEHIAEGSINKSVCKCLWQAWMRGNMSIQSIVQITVICNTVIPSAWLPFILPWTRLVSLISWCYHPRSRSLVRAEASLITIHWQLQESQHLLTPSTRSAFIILVTLHLSDVTWYETLSLCLMADVWYSLDRDTQGRGSGNPRLLMSRWGSGAQPERQHLLIFHPVHLHNKQETHQVSQPTQTLSEILRFSP